MPEATSCDSELYDLYENAPRGYHSLNAAGLIVRMNATELEWLGYSREEVVGRSTLRELVAPSGRERYDEAFRALVRGEAIRDFETVLVKKDGAPLPVVLSATVVHDPEGRFVCTRANVFDGSRRKLAEERARQVTERLQALSHRLVQIQDEERRRLAGELHDEIGQNLTALSINLNTIKCGLSPESVDRIGARIEDCLGLVEAIVDSIYRLIAELRPIGDHGLIAMLRSYGAQFGRRTGVAVEVQGVEPVPPLAEKVEATLFRIVQEALTNVAKHAHASRVSIEFDPRPGGVELVIADDGCGFNVQAVSGRRGRLGLLTMRERAEAVNAHLQLESRAGQGTRVVVEVPKAYHENPCPAR